MLWTPRIWFQKGKKMGTLHPITYPTCHPQRPFVAPSLLDFPVHLKKLGQSCFEKLLFLEKSWSGSNSVFFFFFSLFSVVCVWELGGVLVIVVSSSCIVLLDLWVCFLFWELGVGSRKLEIDEEFSNEFDYRCYWVWDECNIYCLCLHKNNLWEAPQGGITAHVRDWIKDWSWTGTI